MLRIASCVKYSSRIVLNNRSPQLVNALRTNFKVPRASFSTAEGPASGATTEESTTTEEAAVPPPADALNDKIAALEKEIKDLKDKVVRSYAEEENVRRIARRDVNNAKDFANQSFAKSMLEVSDDLERALSVAPKEKTDNNDMNLIVEGIQMTEKNLQKIFLKFGISKFGAVDDVFDPSIHDALFQMPAGEGQATGTIGQVLKSGYKLKDRVIRAAEVGARSL
jgi:molecular chaperone GrpE